MFALSDRRLYTWRSPADTKDHIVRNQCDCILINNRYKNSINAVNPYPRADVICNHNALIVAMQMRLNRLKDETKTTLVTTKIKETRIHQK